MSYTLLRGHFVIRYPDLRRQGPEPDGDTVRFRPDTPALVETLPRQSGTPAGITARGVSVRLEAIDALETHFGDTHQELAGANAARDALLAGLGFTGVRFFADLPNKVEAADQDELPGHLLSNGVDANGRLIGFVYPGEPAMADGTAVFLEGPLVDRSVNAALLSTGLVYPAFYSTLPTALRSHLATVSRAARDAHPPAGLWPRSTADPGGPASVPDLDRLQELVVWPKLFRRVVGYLAAGFTDFDHFDSWLRADPVHRDDALFLLDRLEAGNMHDVITAAGQAIQLTLWPEDFVITPDPAAPGAGTGRRGFRAGDVVIVAALPDPVGVDPGHETLTLVNTTATGIDLTGWALTDDAGGRHQLTGTLPGGAVRQIRPDGIALGNRGDALVLADTTGTVIDQVAYTQRQVRPGRTICFGR
jgi:hypothetical protein